MGTENEGNEGSSQELYYTYTDYSDELASLSENLEAVQETQEAIALQMEETSQAIVEGVGVMSALIGMIIGFFAMIELLKVWLE